MSAPSEYEKRLIAMFDSFSKTVAKNFCRNLTERNGECYIYSPSTDEIYFDITCLNLPEMADEELPFQ